MAMFLNLTMGIDQWILRGEKHEKNHFARGDGGGICNDCGIAVRRAGCSEEGCRSETGEGLVASCARAME
jgi:hypothetical protein